jgi:hypothetical protein
LPAESWDEKQESRNKQQEIRIEFWYSKLEFLKWPGFLTWAIFLSQALLPTVLKIKMNAYF